MIEAKLFSAWDNLIGSAVLLAVIILALGVIVGVARREDALRQLGLVVGVVIWLMMMPAIVMGLWNTLSLGQQFGVVAVFIVILLFVSAARRTSLSARRR